MSKWDETKPSGGANADGDVEKTEAYVILASRPLVEFDLDETGAIKRPREWDDTCYFDVTVFEGEIKNRESKEKSTVKKSKKGVRATIGTSSDSLLGTIKGLPLNPGKIRIDSVKAKKSGMFYYVAVQE